MDKEHAQRIIEWRESIARMPDNQFFELMRMYVGEVKTPFNKQKLVEELSVFLRKIENKEKIAKLLSESDMKVIAAIKFIGNASLKKLTTFFEGTFTYSKLYERIINLEERLIIYKHESEGRELLHVNPHLEPVLLAHAGSPCRVRLIRQHARLSLQGGRDFQEEGRGRA